MSTQYSRALKDEITPEMRTAAKFDNVAPEFILNGLKNGTIVIPKNRNHDFPHVRAIGDGLHTKVNVNIGSSPEHIDLSEEIQKLEIALKYGTDSLMDLSLGFKLNEIRRELLKRCTVMFGTVPIYQAGFELSLKKREITDMTIKDYLKVIEQQAKEGVDFMTIHSGITLSSAEALFSQPRLLNVVSRGGSFLIAWMKKNSRENPLYEHFDEILDICREYDVTVSLGDGLRPGATSDATDRGQVAELTELGRLIHKCRDKKVQVMIEGPGHVPYNQIETNMRMQKRLCEGAPFYVLGPLPIDFAPGYDHIVGAVGGALAAYTGANFLCYVTPAEHIKLPDADDVKQGLMASRIAGYCADLARGFADVKERTDAMSCARRKLDWKEQMKYALDPELLDQVHKKGNPKDTDYCSMCGEFCAVKKLNELMK
jgi:phosphomethylpyrimidine synthase